MDTPTKIPSPPQAPDENLGITFAEIHSDEPHEGVNAEKLDGGDRYAEGNVSHLTNHDDVFDVGKAFTGKQIETGTIVSDKRSNRPSFAKTLRSAFGEWWGNTRSGISQSIESIPQLEEKPKPKIAKAETRAGVVQEAMGNSMLAPKDDHKIVVEKMRTFKQDSARATYTPAVVKDADKNKATWSHTVENPPMDTPPPKPIPPPTPKPVPPPPPQKKTLPDLRASMVAPIVETRSKVEPQNFPTTRTKPSVPPVTVQPKPVPPPEKISTMHVPAVVERAELPSFNSPVQIAPSVHPEADVKEIKHTVAPVPRILHMHIAAPSTEKKLADVPPPKPIPPPTPKPVPPPPPQKKTLPDLRASMVAPIVETRSKVEPHKVEPENLIAPKRSPDTPQIQTERVQFAETPPVPPEKEEIKPAKLIIERPIPVEKIPIQVLEKPKGHTEVEEFHSTTRVGPVAERIEKLKSTPHLSEVALKKPRGENPFIHIFLAWGVRVGIVLVGVGLAIGASMYFNVFDRGTEPESETVVQNEPEIVEESSFMIGGTSEAFLTMLRDRVEEAPSGMTRFAVTIPDGAGARPATSEEVLSFIGVSLSGKTMRALNDTFTIGSITTTRNEPFIVIQSYNFDILFSGFLAWESQLYEDFVPFFGEAFFTNSRFKDAVRDNSSTRILYDAEGKEVFLYSFIDQNTVVITTSGEALSKLISHL